MYICVYKSGSVRNSEWIQSCYYKQNHEIRLGTKGKGSFGNCHHPLLALLACFAYYTHEKKASFGSALERQDAWRERDKIPVAIFTFPFLTLRIHSELVSVCQWEGSEGSSHAKQTGQATPINYFLTSTLCEA
jgi:hypothetical protein